MVKSGDYPIIIPHNPYGFVPTKSTMKWTDGKFQGLFSDSSHSIKVNPRFPVSRQTRQTCHPFAPRSEVRALRGTQQGVVQLFVSALWWGGAEGGLAGRAKGQFSQFTRSFQYLEV